MKNASGTEEHGQGERGEAGLLFPSDGHFSQVVPLSQGGAEASRAGAPPESGEPEEQDETTLVPARINPSPAYASHAKWGRKSRASMAAVLVLSFAAGAAAGGYMLRSQRPSETHRPSQPAAGEVTAGESEGKLHGTEPAAEPSIPQTSGRAPQTNPDSLAAEPLSAVPPVVPAASGESDTKPEGVNMSAPLRKASRQVAEPPVQRAAGPEPRGVRPARAAEASPPPSLTRADAGQRRPDRHTPEPAIMPERPPLISSPSPSAKPKKVIQWP